MNEYLSRERLQDILSGLSRRRCGVIGDLALDAYWYADMSRSFLSRETPLFPRPIVREVYSPGAGANVAANLQALGVGEVVVFSVLGDDWRGGLLQQELSRRGIVVEHLVVSDARGTSTYVKPILMGYDSQQEDARLDFENAEPLAPDLEEALIGSASEQMGGLDAVLVADQFDVNGVITEAVREAFNELAGRHPHKFFAVDSRQRIRHFRHMVLKPNWVETVTAIDPERDPREVGRDELARMGQTLSRRSGRPTFVTLSEDGVLVCQEASVQAVPAGPTRPPLDPVGAGDTFISALTASLAADATPTEAAAIANLAAAVTVEKLNQTGVATPDEILARYDLATT